VCGFCFAVAWRRLCVMQPRPRRRSRRASTKPKPRWTPKFSRSLQTTLAPVLMKFDRSTLWQLLSSFRELSRATQLLKGQLENDQTDGGETQNPTPPGGGDRNPKSQCSKVGPHSSWVYAPMALCVFLHHSAWGGLLGSKFSVNWLGRSRDVFCRLLAGAKTARY